MILNMTSGAALNFDIKAYATEAVLLAATPKANTIGIITDTPITGWTFRSDVPEDPAEGLVWIATGNGSSVPFSAVKKNVLQVYPLSARQYVSGTWEDVTAKSYQNGAWKDWIVYILYNGQTYYDYVTQAKTGSITFADGVFTLAPSTSGTMESYVVFGPVDITAINEITATHTQSGAGSATTSVYGCVFVSPDTGAAYSSAAAIAKTDGWTGGDTVKTLSLDVSALSGEYYVYCGMYSTASTATARTTILSEVTAR